MVLSCKKIKKSFGAADVLTDVTFLIENKERATIVGVNGSGKTTLLKIITGELLMDDGELIIQNGARLGYLPQMADLESDNTIYDELLKVFETVISKEAEMRNIEEDMSRLTGDELEAAMDRYAALTQEFEQSSGYEYKSRIRGVINGLGFSDNGENIISKLSGGQKTRVALGKLLLTEPEILLLDEPTNHLDIENIQWLEEYLKDYSGSVLIVSHDRYFLDKVVTKTIEIENKKSTVYNGNYSFFAHKKELDRQIQLKSYLDQQKEIKRQEEIIKTLKSFNREKSIKAAESKEKRLDMMEKLEKPETLPENMRIILTPKRESGNDVLFVEDLAKSFDGLHLFSNIKFDIKKGEKVALIGANGIGKTTMFKIINGQLQPDRGHVRYGVNVIVGYYDQEHALLDENKSIFQEISDAYPKLTNGEIRNMLASFVFTGDDVFKQISMLSGGEKGRVSLAKIMLGGANFLILDEPTNHLDLFSKEILEDALRNFSGTVFYISHDRYFINNISTKIIELDRNGISVYLGNYDYYLEKKITAQKDAAENKLDDSSAKTDWIKNKGNLADERKRRARLAALEKEIESLEQRIAEADEEMTLPHIYSDPAEAKRAYDLKVSLTNDLNERYLEWDELAY